MGTNMSFWAMKYRGFSRIPSFTRIPLTTPPVGDSSWYTNVPTTQERKWGMYVMVCTTLLNFLLAISLTRMVKRMVTGNVVTRVRMLIFKVLPSTR